MCRLFTKNWSYSLQATSFYSNTIACPTLGSFTLSKGWDALMGIARMLCTQRRMYETTSLLLTKWV